MTDSAFKISTDKRAFDLDMIHAFLAHHTHWAKGISRLAVERSIEGAVCFGGFVDSRQVAFARLITDHATFGYVCDVFVLDAYRGRGYAKALMHAISDFCAELRLRRLVLVTSDAHGLYESFGFQSLASPERYMELHRPHVYGEAQSRDEAGNLTARSSQA